MLQCPHCFVVVFRLLKKVIREDYCHLCFYCNKVYECGFCWQVLTIPFSNSDYDAFALLRTYVTQEESLWEHLESLFFKLQKVMSGWVSLAVPPSQWWWVCVLPPCERWGGKSIDLFTTWSFFAFVTKRRRGFRGLSSPLRGLFISPGVGYCHLLIVGVSTYARHSLK